MKNKVLHTLTWIFTGIVIVCLIAVAFLWFLGGRWLEKIANVLFPVLIETMFLSLLLASVFTLAEHYQHYGRTLFDRIYKACLCFGLITLVMIGRDVAASAFSSTWGILDMATDKNTWYTIVRIYGILVLISAIALICAFVIKLISLVYNKDCGEKKKRVFFIAGYIVFVFLSLVIACVESIYDYASVVPIFIILLTVFFSVHRKWAQVAPAYYIITKKELADFIVGARKNRFGKRYLNKEQYALLEKLSQNLSDDEFETMQSIIKTYSKPSK